MPERIIHPEDEQSIHLMCGGRIPPEVSAEYQKWRTIYHRGFSGSFSPETLVSIIVSAGYSVDIQADRSGIMLGDRINWRHVSDGTRVQMMDEDGKLLKKGTYTGMIDMGTLGILFDGEGEVREVNPDRVELLDETEDHKQFLEQLNPGSWVAVKTTYETVKGQFQGIRADGKVKVSIPDDSKEYRLFPPGAIRVDLSAADLTDLEPAMVGPEENEDGDENDE